MCVKQIKAFFIEEEGIGVVEIILILVILVSIVLIFRTKIQEIVKKAFSAIAKDSDAIIG